MLRHVSGATTVADWHRFGRGLRGRHRGGHRDRAIVGADDAAAAAGSVAGAIRSDADRTRGHFRRRGGRIVKGFLRAARAAFRIGTGHFLERDGRGV